MRIFWEREARARMGGRAGPPLMHVLPSTYASQLNWTFAITSSDIAEQRTKIVPIYFRELSKYYGREKYIFWTVSSVSPM